MEDRVVGCKAVEQEETSASSVAHRDTLPTIALIPEEVVQAEAEAEAEVAVVEVGESRVVPVRRRAGLQLLMIEGRGFGTMLFLWHHLFLVGRIAKCIPSLSKSS